MKKVIIRRNFADKENKGVGGAIFNVGSSARLFVDNIDLVGE